MQLAKITAGHWDGDEFSNRYQFGSECIANDEIRVGFVYDEGNPFTTGRIESTADIEQLTQDGLEEAYRQSGLDRNGNAHDPAYAARQLVKFRDIPDGTPVFLYVGRNMVFAVGRIVGEYEYDPSVLSDDAAFDYPHVRPVEWAEAPRRFNRKHFLPETLQNFVKDQRTVRTLAVEPDSQVQTFLQLCVGMGEAMTDIPEAEKTALLS
jgi:predicted Mrr-cat superfamily restriction endonuclease